MPETQNPSDRRAAWGENQRALCRTLGLSIEEWLGELSRASERKMALTAAVIGALSSAKLGLSALDRLDAALLLQTAKTLIDPNPPAVENPLLAEAIRRKSELVGLAGKGAARLRRDSSTRKTPELPSADEATSDAPGKTTR